MSEKTISNWKEYQEKIAEIFRSIGAVAITDYKVNGARGKHAIDVWVSIKKFGVSVSWVCECKLWNSPIPKEKVLTLYEIAKDVGADRGFLFSESGFQSGAIRSTKNTNITLISIDELEERIAEEFQELTLIKFLKLVNSIRTDVKKGWIDDLKNPRFIEDIEFDTCILIDGQLMYMSLEIQKALNSNWPIYISRLSKPTVKCTGITQLNMILEEEIIEIQNTIVPIKKKISENNSRISNLRNSFIKSIDDLIVVGEFQLFDKLEPLEEKAQITLKKMKKVDKTASELKKASAGSLKTGVYKIMNFLIDTVYLHLSYNTIDRKEWDEAIENVKNQIRIIENIKNL
ncbi:restriction endonuclease [Aequorivita antarctica]|uniref:restriction endonuclease n=1 Tax=Aequorivita antarctica TaxID=153266 RepID=UPI000DBC3949|nr:restriction endonuclease [Aequorivita antarctica]SRX76388.1 hypothetical protein AEQU3_03388 [Aequorivita antarctica]